MNEVPRGKWRRSAIGTKTAARVGGKLIGFYAKRPFLSSGEKHRARERVEKESAAVVFEALSLLKGTAVKIAQMLSIEMDIFPESVCRELAKSCNQVLPMNRAMVRKAVGNAFGEPLEALFEQFDTRAFAAASLGQVHRALAEDGTPLAVKVQYPGIGETIKSDMRLVRGILRPLPEYDIVLPVLEEIELRLDEEIDYEGEANNIAWFGSRMPERGYRVPGIKRELCSNTVLSMTFLQGVPLNEWLKAGPDQEARDIVAQRLNDWFLYCFYELHCIHADPNPGNFIIDGNLNVGIVDFGCIRHFDPAFTEKYRCLIRSLIANDRKRHIRLFQEFDLVKGELDAAGEDLFSGILSRFSDWYGRLVAAPLFDFGANPDFMKDAKAISRDIYKTRQHIKLNANFVYLDRTRYGMLRLFELMRARVRIGNEYETP